MEENRNVQELRHSAAHLLAHALLELFPNTILTIGPATQDGFFYDVLPERNFKEEDLPLIEKKMLELADKNIPITHTQISKEKAKIIFKNNPFKLELINDIPGDTVGLSQQGDFYDLCKGGHVPSTGYLKHVKLSGISGSYWRADKKNAVLQRISGTAFFTQQELDLFLQRKEEALKYDHRRLGKQLDLFSFHEEGVGFPFFHAKGQVVINILKEYLRSEQKKRGYQEIATPIMLSDTLWKRSGHYAHYKDNMYFCVIDEKNNAIRPMNCPGSFLVFQERPRSYRELPLRLAEFGLVHRHELSGVLHGLMRVRAFTIDDTHIFCPINMLEQEIIETIELIHSVLKRFNFSKIKVGLSTKPENAMGSDEIWEKATNALQNALEKSKIAYEIQPGEGAFYGPKIEFVIEDSMERKWQCSTIQVDFFQAENFDLSFINNQGVKERPVIIHRAVYGSFERFFAILLEHYKGHLPFWLAPVQIKVLTITDEQMPYATAILKKLETMGLRAEIDTSSDQISGKIKAAQIAKIPWMLVLGKKEVENQTITLRFSDGTQKNALSWEEFAALAQENNAQ